MGRQDYINLYRHDFAFAGWLKFGCIGFERNAGLLAPCSVKALMHGPPRGQAIWYFSICPSLAAIDD